MTGASAAAASDPTPGGPDPAGAPDRAGAPGPAGDVADPRRFRVVVIGSGFAGLGMAIRLRQAGMHDFVVLERADDLGGTWRDNTYPGAACDIPSHLYSYSFAPNPDWSRTYSPGPEILAYLRRCAERYGVVPHLQFGHTVREARWDDAATVWRVDTDRGTFTADVLVSATGALSEPSLPAIPGLDTFAGAAFHSATWDDDHDLTGERVAVIGTGASAVQLVPRIADRAARVLVFQRTPPWVVPRGERRVRAGVRRLYARVPATQRAVRAVQYWTREALVPGLARDRRWLAPAQRVAAAHLATQVRDPVLRKALTPDYSIGCKRILSSDDWYPTLCRPDVDVVSAAVREVTPTGVVTTDGTAHDVDTIVFATGFHVTDASSAELIRGRDGRRLAEVWDGSPEAYLGTTVAGFPNLFLLVGPNTGLGHNSMVFMIESQLSYVLDAVRALDRRGLATLEVRPDVQAAYNRRLQDAMRRTVWTAGGCASWYLDRRGRNATLWPDFTWRFRRRTRRVSLADYAVGRADAALPAGRSVPRSDTPGPTVPAPRPGPAPRSGASGPPDPSAGSEASGPSSASETAAPSSA